MCNTNSKIHGLAFSWFYFNGYNFVYCVPWFLPPRGSDGVDDLVLRINILAQIKFFRKGWKVVDLKSGKGCSNL